MTAIMDAKVLPMVRARVRHLDAMPWREVPAFCAQLQSRDAMAAKALMFAILSAGRTSEVLEMT